MELESHRLNPLRLEDWKLCFDIGGRTRLYRCSRPIALAAATAGAVMSVASMVKSLSVTEPTMLSGLLPIALLVGMMAILATTNLTVLRTLIAVWVMATLREATPVATLADVPEITDLLEEDNTKEGSEHGAGDAASLR